MTFIRSPVEKHTSQPESSYMDPETESKRLSKKGAKKSNADGYLAARAADTVCVQRFVLGIYKG